MSIRTPALLAALLCLVVVQPASRLTAATLAGKAVDNDELIAFVGATVIDTTGAAPLSDAVLLVRGAHISAVGPAASVPVPAQARIVDAGGKWIVPGLIDAHVHFCQSGGLYTRPDIVDLTRVRPYGEEIAWLRGRLPLTLARYLASGVTSVVDMAGPEWTYGIRSLAAQEPLAPRVALAGPGLAPSLPAALQGENAFGVAVHSADQARDTVRRLARQGSDFIKIWFMAQPDMDVDHEFEWVRAAIEESHAQGLRAAAHATERDIADRMVAAGADILVHSVKDELIDDALLERMRAGGVIYVTTLDVMEGYWEVRNQQVHLTEIERRVGDPQVIATLDDLEWLFPGRRRRPALPPDNRVTAENLLRVHAAGITVAAGSDAGNIGTLHGPALHREVELMAQAGLSPQAILVAATRGGAAVLGREEELGTLEPGKLADLVIIEADPLADIRNLHRIDRVVKGGVVLDPSRFPIGR
jgi:imidazolonepropionase-like amidohydrolase